MNWVLPEPWAAWWAGYADSAMLDTLRSRIKGAIGLPLEQAWLGIMFTADERWS